MMGVGRVRPGVSMAIEIRALWAVESVDPGCAQASAVRISSEIYAGLRRRPSRAAVGHRDGRPPHRRERSNHSGDQPAEQQRTGCTGLA
jgi:hypothetical protein